ncbi:MAG TPA: MgtC/SapB family protein [Alphaproteobacteria bacterium]|nr:MgtC/SapB family protein [Alphaproteobacteria bacterium]
MTETLSWQDITLRLALTVVAGAAMGLNRWEHGRPAGLRTTLLVCLAASVAMIQANLLLGVRGKTPDSFPTMDVMRLPLGILSGMGFIGGGTILHRGNLVIGVTTAATLWFVTVMELAFGGGQIGLGLAALAIGLITLWMFKIIEQRLREDRRIRLVLTLDDTGPSDEEVRLALLHGDLKILSSRTAHAVHDGRRAMRFELRWRARETESEPPAVLRRLQSMPGIARIAWTL